VYSIINVTSLPLSVFFVFIGEVFLLQDCLYHFCTRIIHQIFYSDRTMKTRFIRLRVRTSLRTPVICPTCIAFLHSIVSTGLLRLDVIAEYRCHCLPVVMSQAFILFAEKLPFDITSVGPCLCVCPSVSYAPVLVYAWVCFLQQLLNKRANFYETFLHLIESDLFLMSYDR
jgi:hypothetical protein